MKKLFTLFSILFIISNLSAGADTTKCNWKSRISRFDVYNNCDSHKNTVNIVGKIGLYQVKNCSKPVRRVWRLSSSTGNTVIGNGENLYYKVTQNGTYTICLSLYDSCNNCDTVLCKSVSINCLGCNWKSKIGGFEVWNNCDSNKTNKNIGGIFYLNQNYKCNKKYTRKWTVNNTVVGSGEHLYYQVFKNGTYTVCMSVYDSCNNCDTMICKTTTVNCFSGCNWKSKVNDFHITSSCDSNKNPVHVSGSFILNKNYTCTKRKLWKWTVNNTFAGSSEKLFYKVTANGTYNVCLWLYDSCNNCDTSFCKTVTVNCISAGCNWKNKVNDFHITTSCDSNKNPVHISGSFILNKNYTCTKRKLWKWTVNNAFAGSSEKLFYKVTANGTYNVCLWLYDSCNNCDTSFCKTVTVNCISTNSCNWKSKIDDFLVTSGCDSNKNPVYIGGRFHFTKNYTCTKGKLWKWTVNNTIVSTSEKLYYKVSANGTYNVCLRLYDSCNNCDTSYCKTVTVNCLSKHCNWKSKVNDFFITTSCDSNKNPVHISGRFILNKNYTCTKRKLWKWTVNNTVVSTSEKLYYTVSSNGNYNVCLWLYDSCNNCDTTFCKTVTINCVKSCNWKSKVNDFFVTTSCDSNKNPVYISGRFILNKNYHCTKRKVWKWTVNNTVVSTSEKLYYKVSANGTYNVCLWLYDSCNNCDTSFCKTVTVNCVKAGCNWKNRIGGFDVRSNCDSNKNTVQLIGKFYLNQNYKCNKKLYRKWLVNNTFAGYGENLYYTVPHNGTYKVCLVVYDSCNKCDTSLCKTVQVNCRKLAVDDLYETNNVQIYPNPAQELVNISFDQAGVMDVQVSILDLSGRVVQDLKNFSSENGSCSMDIRQLPPGMYLVKISLGEQAYHVRLIKN